MIKNQKLTDQQIQTIKELKSRGVRISFISKLLQAEGLALSTAYYHLSDNRQAYENCAKKSRQIQREYIKQRIFNLIETGNTTGQIASDWNVPLKTINKLYVG